MREFERADPIRSIQWPTEAEACHRLYDFERWEGSVADNLNILRGLIESGESDEELVWGPSRLLSTVLDADLADFDRIVLTEGVTTLALEAIRGSAQREFVDYLAVEFERCNLLDARAEQWIDPRTLASTNLPSAQEAAQRLFNEFSEERLVMLILGHGGLAAGMLVAREYYQKTYSHVPAIFPLRFSRRKFGDKHLRISPMEEEIIGMATPRATLVLIEEDASSGATLSKAIQFASRTFSAKQCIGLVASDHRSDETKRKQGVWWEKVSKPTEMSPPAFSRSGWSFDYKDWPY